MSQPLLSSTTALTAFNLQELQTVLEPLVRQVVREELERVMKAYSPTPTCYLAEGMPLHADLTEILARQAQREVQLFSHQEVWDE